MKVQYRRTTLDRSILEVPVTTSFTIESDGQEIVVNEDVAQLVRAMFPKPGLRYTQYARDLAALIKMRECINNVFSDVVCATATCRMTECIMGRPCESDDDREHYETAERLVSNAILISAHEGTEAPDSI